VGEYILVGRKVGRPRKSWRDQHPWRRNKPRMTCPLLLIIIIIIIILCFIFGRKLLLNTYCLYS